MANSIDNFLGIHAQALGIESRRTQLLAANIANVDTPNFKARDLDFKAALAQAGAPTTGALPLTGTHGALQAAAAADQDPALLYRVPMAPSLDGNTVDDAARAGRLRRERGALPGHADAAQCKSARLMTAITGQ